MRLLKLDAHCQDVYLNPEHVVAVIADRSRGGGTHPPVVHMRDGAKFAVGTSADEVARLWHEAMRDDAVTYGRNTVGGPT